MATGAAPTRNRASSTARPRPHWEHLDHGADVGVRGIGATKSAAFEQAALALTAVIADPAAVEPRETVALECDGTDDETLLVAWLNALIAEMAARRMLFSQFEVEFRPRQIVATARGERVSVERHRPAVEVKRATDTDLRVARLRSGEWLAQTVLDV